jgi:hypothetical protein
MPSQITCVTKRNTIGDANLHPDDLHETIKRVGGVRMQGERFNIARQQSA